MGQRGGAQLPQDPLNNFDIQEAKVPCATFLCTQILPGESWSPRSADTPESTGKTTTSAQIPCPRGIHLEPPGHRNQGTAGDRMLPVSISVLELTLCHSSPYLNPAQRELVTQDC